MRADRLLALVLQLQAHGRMTGKDLAEKLEVSERTLHRDMEALSIAGVPVFAVRGAGGGWQLDPEWKVQVPGLDEAELHALLMIQPRNMGDSGIAASATRAFNKLLAAMPSALRDRAATIQKRLYVDPAGWWGSAEEMFFLPVLQEALMKDQKLSIHYQRFDGESSVRVVDPLGLVAKGMSWYLVANSAKGFRTFRLSRIRDVQILELACQRPENFDLEEHWKQSTASFKESRSRFPVTFITDPETAKYIQQYCKPLRQEVVDRSQKSGVLLEITYSDEKEAEFILLGLGSRVEILSPRAFRKKIDQEITRMYKKRIQSSRKPRKHQ